jgi:hypothetical protein
MGWQSDWLYGLIFQEVTRLWQQTRREGAGRYGPPPDCFYVAQYTDVSPDMIACRGTIIRLWHFDADTFTLIPEGKTIIYNTTIRGMFYVHGSIKFYITPTRKYLYWNSFFGPRYGRGKVFRIVGQGATGMLEKDMQFGEWVS